MECRMIGRRHLRSFRAYQVYKDCMYLPTFRKYLKKMDSYVYAVGFYKKCGFVCEKHLNHYEDGDVERFECYLKVEKQKY